MNLFTTFIQWVCASNAQVTLQTVREITLLIEHEITRPAAEWLLAAIEERKAGKLGIQAKATDSEVRRTCAFTPYFGVRVTFEFQTGVPTKKETAVVEVHVPASARVAQYVIVPLLEKKFGTVEYTMVENSTQW